MNRKTIFFIIVLLALLAGGAYLWQQQKPSKPNNAEEAIRQAKEYRPEGGCTQALVPAVHKATGAKLTFPNGCLAPGWEPES